MTDKQIINDVQECEFLQEGHCNLYFNSEISDIYPNCIDISECNYKQLKAKYNEFVSRYKAKEQECEEKQKTAQDAINKLCAEKSALHNELDQLKAENEELKEEIKHINTRSQEYIAENNRMTEKIIDGLSCDNCPESKRCQEQQTKKEYAINQVLQDIPSEYANVIDRLKQIIPSITRCDYVLEKQLKAKEQECEELKEDRERWKSNFNGKVSAIEELLQQLDQFKVKNIKISKTLAEIKEIADKDFRHTAWEEYAKQLKQILQKISECEVEDAR